MLYRSICEKNVSIYVVSYFVSGTNCEIGPCETYEADYDGETFCENGGQCLNGIEINGGVSITYTHLSKL